MSELRTVDQTRFHAPGELPGDCFAACIATLLGCSIEEVPRPGMDEREDWSRYWAAIGDFLHGRGFHLLHLPQTGEWNSDGPNGVPLANIWTTAQFSDEAPATYAIANGKSPRGDYDHSVVVDLNRGIVHDPHPSRNGIETCKSVEFIVPLLPAALTPVSEPSTVSGRGEDNG